MSAHQPITAAPADDLLATAYSILAEGASVTIGGHFSADEEKDWLSAAQEAKDGDSTNLRILIEREEAWEQYGEYAYDTHFRAEPMEFDAWFTASGSTVPGYVA